ncbi:MAG: hypothetical protein K2Q26_10270 [Bdellovibrionales bacterium]|nr:hypothetical protein [Bdellovibrionales bacterium]
MIQVYWVMLVPFVVFLVSIEILKDDSPNLRDIFRRLFISVILLLTFPWTMSVISTIGDAVIEKIDGLQKLSDVLTTLGPNAKNSGSWFGLRETIIYIFSLAAYLIAYLGFFVATALTHFTWTILYVASPLMILMYVSRYTDYVTKSLYKGLVQVIVWKWLWSLLGVLLLKLAMQPQESGLEDYLMSIILNLCIGVSILFIPLVTKSLISDGLNSVASSLAAVPALAAGSAIKMAAVKYSSKITGAAKGAALFTAKPLTNPIAGRMEMLKDRTKPRIEKFKASYGSVGLPKEILQKRKLKNWRKK